MLSPREAHHEPNAIISGPGILSGPDILSGTPCFAGTRVPVRMLFECIESNEAHQWLRGCVREVCAERPLERGEALEKHRH